MSSILTCPRGHRWLAYGPGQPEGGRATLLCPHCGAQPETLPPLPLRPFKLADRAARSQPPDNDTPTRISDPCGHDFPSPAGINPPAPVAPSVQVEGYEVIEEVGRGGMGVVYKARQEGLKRLVALKMILSAGHAGASELARFLIEAEAVARLHDPNIVQIYQVGNDEGRPFLALEFVEGGSLADRLDGTPVPPRLAASFLIPLASAMQHAHELGIVHRDLKPANILLAQPRGQQSSDKGSSGDPADANEHLKVRREAKGSNEDHWAARTTPKITDFGLAKRLDSDAGETKSGAVMGTPSYMAPEQAGGSNPSREGEKGGVGPATDIYALGAILYELITGRPPFRGESPLDTLYLAATEEPVPPKRLQPTCPRDLETICLKCLEKEPAKRYGTARALAQDLQRLLDGQPILARPTSSLERALKWSRRHPAGAALLTLSLVVLIGTIVAGWYYSAEQHFQGLQLRGALSAAKLGQERAEAAQHQADLAREDAIAQANKAHEEEQAARVAVDQEKQAKGKAQRLLYDTHMSLAQREWQMAHIDRVLQLLQEQNASDRSEFRGFEWNYLDRLCHQEARSLSSDSGIIWSVGFSPDAAQLVSASSNLLQGQAEVRVWDLKTGRPVLSFPHHYGRVSSVAFQPGGQLVGSAGRDAQLRPVVFLWDARTGQIVTALYGHFAEIHDLAFSPDGRRVATAGYDKTVRIWDLARDSKTFGSALFIFPSEVNFNTVAFSPDGKRVAASGSDEVVNVWDVTDGPASVDQRGALSLRGHAGKVLCVTFSPDGSRIATTGYDHTVRLWNAETGNEVMTLRVFPAKVEHLSFSPDGKVLAGSDDRSMIKLWNVQNGNEVRVYRGHAGAINCLEFAPRGRLLASAGSDSTIRLWDTSLEQEALTLRDHHSIVHAVFEPGRDRIASGGHDSYVRIWDADRGRAVCSFEAHDGAVLSLAYHPKGRYLATAGRDRMVRIWDTQLDCEWFNLPEFRTVGALTARISSPLSPMPWLLARQQNPQLVQSLRGQRGQHSHADDVTCVAYSPDGKYLASGSLDKTVIFWDAETGRLLRVLQHDSAVSGLAFSTDGRFLATATTDGKAVLLWELTGSAPRNLQVELRKKFLGHTDHVTGIVFTPDGKHLASSSLDGTVQIWDPDSDAPLAILRGHKGAVNSLAFTPDGRRLATASDDLTVKLWDTLDLSSPEETLSLQGHADKVVSVEFDPHGQRLLSGGGDGIVKVWDGRPRSAETPRPKSQVANEFQDPITQSVGRRGGGLPFR